MRNDNEVKVEFVEKVPRRMYGRQKNAEEYAEAAAVLRERPGEWAVVFTGKETTARSCFDAMKRHGMETVRRERGRTVYARYNPEK